MKLKLSENIRNLRRKKDITQEELAERLCVSGQIVSRWENGVTYPDVELLPVIAEFFGVTVDELLGAAKTESGEAPEETYEKLNTMTDHRERLALLREMHRDYPCDMAALHSLCSEVDDVEEQRKYTEELLAARDCPKPYCQSAIERMVENETDEERLTAFLDRYATEYDRCRDSLLEKRYLHRKEYEKYEPLKQAHALDALLIQAFPRLTPDWESSADLPTCLWASEQRLRIINQLTDTVGKSMTTGDGVPDMWFSHRFHYGTTYACYLAASGRIEEALTAVEEIVELCGAFFALPDNTKLSYRCPAFRNLEGGYYHAFMRGPAVGEEYATTMNIVHFAGVRSTAGTPMYGCLHITAWPCLMIRRFTERDGWEWFDPIRNDPRFLKCIERFRGYVLTRPLQCDPETVALD